MTMQDFNDKILLSRQGDKESMRSLYEEYYAFVYFTALSYLKNKVVAEDLASEIFVSLFTKEIEEVQNPKTFLYVMTANKAKNILKAKNNNNKEINLDEISDCTASDFYSVEIGELMLQLPELERAIFVSRIFGGYSFIEIAKMYKLSVSTAKRKYKMVCEYMVKHLKD